MVCDNQVEISQCWELQFGCFTARNSCKRREGVYRVLGAGYQPSVQDQTCRDDQAILRHQMLPPTQLPSHLIPVLLLHATSSLGTLVRHVSQATYFLFTRWLSCRFR